MKVEMAILQKKDRTTRALKPFLVDERWASRIERQTKGRIYRVPEEDRQLPKRPARKVPARKASRRNAEE